jgi:ArsR family transcriptional regulator
MLRPRNSLPTPFMAGSRPYIWYVESLPKTCNVGDRAFYDAINLKFWHISLLTGNFSRTIYRYMAIWPKEKSVKPFIRVMKALSDPNRVTIMKMLEVKELCVCEITAILGLAQSTVSKHLKILEDAGLVDSRKEGAWVNYNLTETFENKYAEIIQSHLKDWLDDAPQIQKALIQVSTVDRQRICAA